MEFLRIFIFLFISNVQANDISGLNFFKLHSNCKVVNNYLYLEKDKALALGPDRIIRRYKVNCNDDEYKAFLLGDKIRSHFQHVLYVLKGEEVIWVEVPKFSEPLEYQAPEKWIKHFFIKKDLSKIKPDGISGATLTTASFKRMVTRLLELNKL